MRHSINNKDTRLITFRTKKQREPDGGQIVERPDNNEIPSSLESQTQADAGPSRAGLDHVPVSAK